MKIFDFRDLKFVGVWLRTDDYMSDDLLHYNSWYVAGSNPAIDT